MKKIIFPLCFVVIVAIFYPKKESAVNSQGNLKRTQAVNISNPQFEEKKYVAPRAKIFTKKLHDEVVHIVNMDVGEQLKFKNELVRNLSVGLEPFKLLQELVSGNNEFDGEVVIWLRIIAIDSLILQASNRPELLKPAILLIANKIGNGKMNGLEEDLTDLLTVYVEHSMKKSDNLNKVVMDLDLGLSARVSLSRALQYNWPDYFFHKKNRDLFNKIFTKDEV
jgi:hypothetical protein